MYYLQQYIKPFTYCLRWPRASCIVTIERYIPVVRSAWAVVAAAREEPTAARLDAGIATGTPPTDVITAADIGESGTAGKWMVVRAESEHTVNRRGTNALCRKNAAFWLVNPSKWIDLIGGNLRDSHKVGLFVPEWKQYYCITNLTLKLAEVFVSNFKNPFSNATHSHTS